MRPAPVAFILLAVLVALTGARGADDPPAKEPDAPKGWKYVTAKDGSYWFLFPAETRRSGSRERTSKRGGSSVKTETNYCELPDGTALAVSAERYSGAAIKGLKVADVYDLAVAGSKADGYTVSEPKEFVVGKDKGREYLLTKDGGVQRRVLLVARGGRTYDLTVSAADKDKVAGPEADTFLKSFTLTPPAPAKVKADK